MDSGSTHHGSTHSTNVLALQPVPALPGDGRGKPSLQLDTGMAGSATSQQVGLQCANCTSNVARFHLNRRLLVANKFS